MSRFVLVENKAGYMPDSDPIVVDDLGELIEAALGRISEWEDFNDSPWSEHERGILLIARAEIESLATDGWAGDFSILMPDGYVFNLSREVD